MDGRIFISYRREDSSYAAGRLYDRLSQHFGEDRIFMDIDTIKLGVDFVSRIETAVSNCNVLLAIIGQRWLSASDSEGQQRLEDPNDFVRLEIATALSKDIHVIPLLVEDAAIPKTAELPKNLHALVRRNGMEIGHTRFNTDVDLLIQGLETIFEARKSGLDREAAEAETGEFTKLKIDDLGTKETRAPVVQVPDTKKQFSEPSDLFSRLTPFLKYLFNRNRIVWISATIIFVLMAIVINIWLGSRSNSETPNDLAVSILTKTNFPEELASIEKANQIPKTPIVTISPTLTQSSTATSRITPIPPTSTSTKISTQVPPTPTSTPTEILVFEEEFDSNINRWSTGETSSDYFDGNRVIADGKYRWIMTSDASCDGCSTWVYVPQINVKNFWLRFSVKIVEISGDISSSHPAVKVLFRANEDEHYAIYFDNDEFIYQVKAGGVDSTFSDWTKYEAIMLEPNITNFFDIIANDSNFHIYANDQQIAVINEVTITKSGRIGIGVAVWVPNQMLSIEFDDLSIKAIP